MPPTHKTVAMTVTVTVTLTLVLQLRSELRMHIWLVQAGFQGSTKSCRAVRQSYEIHLKAGALRNFLLGFLEPRSKWSNPLSYSPRPPPDHPY